MASYLHGHLSSRFPWFGCSSPLLGYLYTSYCTRHQFHLCRYRRRGGSLLSYISLYDLPSVLCLCQIVLIALVFQAELNVLGMAIYGTELALWTGVFICGGYFNLMPYIQTRLSSRRQRLETERQSGSHHEAGSIALRETPSSTSVFRTPSSGMVERTTVTQEGEDP